MEPHNAAQNPATSKPGITPEAINNNTAFITNVKSPMVNMLMGRVNMSKTGLKKAFRMPNNAAVKNALTNPLTDMPTMR